MQREVTAPIGKNFQVGKVYDLPYSTWIDVAKNLKVKGIGNKTPREKLDAVSREIEVA